ncbi:MAG TPA: SGNH/GDSL hydrolase family protein [Mycobacteriales bacterium]|nr:SGNH/GDSL hydrolase family protein [Mycobacteriales bacterium]
MRLVALGDSTVEGLEDPRPDGSYRGWADQLAEHLARREPGLTYANLAVRGRTVREVRDGQLPAALALQPDIAVVVAGVNDLLRPRLDAAALREDLLHLHGSLTAAGARVLTFTMPDMASVAPMAVALRGRVRLLNGITHEAGRVHGATVVDLAAEPVASHPALWHTDRLHGNAEGHRRIGLALAAALGCDVEDWRAPLDLLPRRPLPRLVADEVAWAAGHLLPWAWRHLRGHSSGDDRACKRPELLPVEPA